MQDIYRNDEEANWILRSEIEKDRKKAEKSSKKVLTIRGKNDKIHKLTRAGHRKSGD